MTTELYHSRCDAGYCPVCRPDERAPSAAIVAVALADLAADAGYPVPGRLRQRILRNLSMSSTPRQVGTLIANLIADELWRAGGRPLEPFFNVARRKILAEPPAGVAPDDPVWRDVVQHTGTKG